MVLKCKDLTPELQVLTAIMKVMKDCSFNPNIKVRVLSQVTRMHMTLYRTPHQVIMSCPALHST